MKKIIFILALFFTLLFNPAKGEVFDITNYNIDLNVKNDNSIDIIEDIDVDFEEYRHGIIRTIPIKNKINRTNGEKSIKKAIIKNISVNQPYVASKKDGNFNIKIAGRLGFLPQLQATSLFKFVVFTIFNWL